MSQNAAEDYEVEDYEPVEAPDEGIPRADRPWFFSASQIETFLQCPRKWAWRYIAGKRSPDAPSARLGTAVHLVLENYLRGVPLPFSDPDPQIREAAAIAAPGIPLIPKPGTPGMTMEEEFRFETFGVPGQPAGQLRFLGKKDIEVPAASSASGLPEIWDHKTSSNMERYGKTEETLLEDPQAIIYAYEAMAAHRSKEVELNWVYYSTRGPRKAKRVHLRMASEHVVPRFLAMRPALLELAATVQSARHPATFYGDETQCDAYGGCPYRSDCEPLLKNKNPFSRVNKR